MKALVKIPNGSVVLQDIAEPIPTNEEVLIEPLYLGLCRTDLLVASGRLPNKFPIILGHEFSGRVISAPAASSLQPGDLVVVNPYTPTTFMGLNCNGALAQRIVAPINQVHLIPPNLDPKIAIFFEPVAAALGCLPYLRKDMSLLISGNNRIADLTALICDSYHIKYTRCSTNNLLLHEVKYDVIIESDIALTNSYDPYIKLLNTKGTLISKSRCISPVSVTPNLLVMKDITFVGVSYGDWNLALNWITENQDSLVPLLSAPYTLANWEAAFSAAHSNESVKSLIQIN